ncbi:MAG: hypothetical protein ACXVEF_43750 [Polyangiales bacterium]
MRFLLFLFSVALLSMSPAARAADVSPLTQNERTSFVIGSSIAFGVGTVGSLAGWSIAGRGCDGLVTNCDRSSQQMWLMSYGAHLVVAPSVARFALGDAKGGLLFTGARAALFGAALWAAPHGTAGSLGAIGLGLVAPAALGVIDLATTPKLAPNGPQVTGIAPALLADHGALLSVGGVW